ncbi:MAG: DUF268 domain-containing protein [Catalinimonas sp.]
MSRLLKGLHFYSSLLGIDGRATLSTLRHWGGFRRDLAEFKRQRGDDTTFRAGRLFPVLTDKHAAAGRMKGHYFHQDLYVARRIYEAKPERHIDIGSRTDGFVAHLAVFRPVEILDIRALDSRVPNISFRQADLMQLPDDLIEATDSVSSLHAIEHFGLGRYGDPIDYRGHLKALGNIAAMLRRGGTFYFSVPIGPQRVDFNAHRVFSINYLLALLQPTYDVACFSYVDDAGELFEDVPVDTPAAARNYGCKFGCGIFVLKKR